MIILCFTVVKPASVRGETAVCRWSRARKVQFYWPIRVVDGNNNNINNKKINIIINIYNILLILILSDITFGLNIAIEADFYCVVAGGGTRNPFLDMTCR